MPSDELHFAMPSVLYALALLPLIWLLFLYGYKSSPAKRQLDDFIDRDLLKYLLVDVEKKRGSLWKSLALFSLVYALLVVALSGPRWNFREIETYSSDQNLVILLDLSQSMEADDVKPSRLTRAKQQIEELLARARDLKVGLVAFAADPHMITPLTRDLKTIRQILPSLDTSLVHVQGSRLTAALDMAEKMIDRSAGRNGAILVISDGGFEDSSAISRAKELAERGIATYAIGVGSDEGAPVKDKKGEFIKVDGKLLLTKLESDKLQEIARNGGGAYFTADYSGRAEYKLLSDLKERASVEKAGKRKVELWDESFYLFVLPALPFLLFWMRRGAIVPLIAAALLPLNTLYPDDLGSYFMNSEQLGEYSFEKGDFSTAAENFNDPYRKGVAYYRAGQYEEAAAMFKQVKREEVAKEASYNLGNAFAMQNKLKEAAAAYEKVLERWPGDQKAADNLALVKKILEEQKQQQEQENKQEQDNNNEGEGDKEKGDKGTGEQNEGDKKESERQRSEEQQESSKNERQQGEEQQKPGENEQQQSEEQQESGENEQQRGGEPLDDERDDAKEGAAPAPMNPSQEESPDEKEATYPSKEDRDADQWLNRIQQNPEQFLKNKFYIESRKNGTRENPQPW